MLPKNASCGNMRVSFRVRSVDTHCQSPLGELLVRLGDPHGSRRWLDAVIAAPHGGVGCELRPRWEGAAQLAVVAVEIRSWSERREQKLRELAQAITERLSVARQRRVSTRDRLEVLRGAAGH